MRSLTLSFCLMSLLAVAHTASAQENVTYPGSVWSSNGTLSPVEKGNVISVSHVEQGVSLRGVELFGTFTGQVDSKRYDWNNRITEGVGLRFTQSIGPGMVRAGVAYLNEKRFISESTARGPSVFVECWFGWRRGEK